MQRHIVNFGRNVEFTTRNYFEPRTEAEVLDILSKHRAGCIRAIGSRHAWSDAIKCEDAIVDVSRLNHVRVDASEGQFTATVGAGCQMKHLLKTLNDEHGLTLPSVGLITEQTIAGVISTATHGAGRNSLSHYMDELRIATFDPETREPTIVAFNGGDELRAARCSLGCLGIIVEVRFRCVPQYYVTERATKVRALSEVLARDEAVPLQQFYLIPHLWQYYNYERKISIDNQRSRLAPLYQLYWSLFIDVSLHVLVKLTAALLRSGAAVRFLFRWVLPPTVFTWWEVTDRSDRLLTMEHELFRHLETELFVPASEIETSAEYLKQVLQVFAGDRSDVDGAFHERLEKIGMANDLASGRGSFVHHYVVAFRKVLADDAMIATTAGDETYYALSLITYVEPRDSFFAMSRFLAKSIAQLFGARPHWGKYFPLESTEVRTLYPELSAFRDVCLRYDPEGVFRNSYVTQVLGFSDND